MAFPQYVSFGHLLKRHRLAAGLTQEELAEQACVSRRAIAALETGARHTPRKDTVVLLARALRLSPAEEALFVSAARQRLPMPAHHAQGLPVSAEMVGQTKQMATQLHHATAFVGRVAELSALERHLAGDGPPLLLLAGEPGIGKSRLLDETATRAREQGWTVLSGGCHRRSGQEPFAPFIGALTRFLSGRSPAQQRLDLHGCGWLVRLLPELAEHALVPAPSWTLPPEQERRLMFAAVERLFSNIAGPAGTLLLLDDLQWAGADALDLLTILLQSPPSVPLRVVAAYRNTEMHPPDPLGVTLADLAAAGLATQHRLGPLSPREASVLLENVLAGGMVAGTEHGQMVLARTGGVPFFLVSCAEALRGEHRASETETVPWTVAQSIRQRMSALPETAQQALRVAAVVGRQTERGILFAVLAQLGQSEHQMLAAVESTHQAHLLVETGIDIYQFPHDLIREVIAIDLSGARRAMLHQRVAEALEALPGELPLERLAYHYQRSERTDKAIEYLERAGDRAWAVYANTEAEGYYRELLARVVGQGNPLDEARVVEKLVKVVRALGHYEEALTLYQQTVDAYARGDDCEGQWRIVAEMGWLYFRRGMYVEGLDHLRPLMAEAERSATPVQLAAVLTLLAALEANTGQQQAALAAAMRAMDLARALGQPVLQVAPPPVVSYARALLDTGRVEEALQVMDEALPLVERTGNEQNLASILRILAAGTLLQGEFAKSSVYRQRALEIVERTGDQGYRMFQLNARGRLSFLSGDWRAARADGEQAVVIYRQLDAVGVPPQPLLLLGELSLAEGRREEALTLLQEGLACAEHMGEPERVVRAHAAFAEWELLQGRPQAVWDRLEPLLEPADRDDVFLIQLWTLLSWAATDLRNEAQAGAWLQQALQRARMHHLPFALVDPLRIEALLATRQERWTEAQTALEECLAHCRAMPYPYAEAKALYVYGQLHAAKGETELAREKYQAALAICERLGEGLYRPHIEQALQLARGSIDP